MKIMAFHGFRGGNGKTTIAINIAYWLSKLEKRVILVDADFKAPAINDYLKEYYDPSTYKVTFPKYLTRIGEDISSVVCRAQVNPTVTFDLLLSGKPGELNFLDLGLALYPGVGRAAAQQMHRFRNGLSELNRKVHYDYAIIDTAPGLELQSLYITLAISDLLIEILRYAEIDFIQASSYLIPTIKSSYQDKEKSTGIKSKYCLLFNEVQMDRRRNYVVKHDLGKEEILGELAFLPALRDEIGIFSAKNEEHEWSQAMKGIAEKVIKMC